MNGNGSLIRKKGSTVNYYLFTMTTSAQTVQQLQQDIQCELTTSNQLLRLISYELQVIKDFTKLGGEFEKNIKQNATLMATLANLHHIDIENLPPITRKHIDMSTHTKQNQPYEEHNTFRKESEMEESQ